ncbi:hypothetical protein ACFS5L_29860 [Streptomyces phyllanthi]|uniref:Uncharacterized protein n=1 Tax=Streptomyces phyllanthi TaxID=1803180 RepID=A0A5N8W655_9ACTN|nr:hypothetical protein [Streptomyces phyllanthi]MPY42386.1 hypothetical protein [Streptomyces phyllanthi]
MPVFRFLAETSDKVAEGIQSCLSGASSYLSVPAVKKQLSNIEGVTPDNASNLVDGLIGLNTVMLSHGWEINDILERIGESRQLDLPDEQKPQLIKRLGSYLETPAIQEVARAADLAGERENFFHTVRVLTDVRPVFGDDPSEKPRAVVVNQTLKLQYFNDRSETRNIFIALNEEDLEDLRDAAIRALSEARNVKSLMDSSGLQIIQTEGE